VLAGVGVFIGSALDLHTASSETVSYDRYDNLVLRGQTEQIAGAVLLTIGAGAIIVGAVRYAMLRHRGASLMRWEQ